MRSRAPEVNEADSNIHEPKSGDLVSKSSQISNSILNSPSKSQISHIPTQPELESIMDQPTSKKEYRKMLMFDDSNSKNSENSNKNVAQNPRSNFNSNSSTSTKPEPPLSTPSIGPSHMFSRFRMKTPAKHNPPPKIFPSSSTFKVEKVTSCIRCRRLKKKCDKKLPECINCEKVGEPCKYVPRKLRKRDYDEVEVKSPISSDNDNLSMTEKPQKSRKLSSSSRSPISSPIVIPSIPSIIPKQTISNSKSWMAVVAPPMPINLFDSKQPLYELNVSNSLPKDISLPSNLQPNFLSNCVTKYFSMYHSMYPLISKSLFLSKSKSVLTEKGIESDILSPEDQFDLYMILGIGCKTIEISSNIPSDNQISGILVSRALKLAPSNFASNDLNTIRSLLLAGLYSLLENSVWPSWEITGRLIRLAFYLGLHTKRFRKLTMEQRETRNRLFWSIYNLDRTVSVSLGKPLGINDDDILVPFPSELNSEPEDIACTNLAIRMRKLEGIIYSKIQSKSVEHRYKLDEKEKILQSLVDDLTGWHQLASAIGKHPTASGYHWHDAMYHIYLTIIFQPSYLNPYPTNENWKTVTESCLHAIKGMYALARSEMLQLIWTTLYRFLNVCYTTLYCLQKLRLKLSDIQVEIGYCIEILRLFASNWEVSRKCADIFIQLQDTVTTPDDTGGPIRDQMIKTFAELNKKFQNAVLDIGLDYPIYNEFYL